MTDGLTEQDFRLKADRALEDAQRQLLTLADEQGFVVQEHLAS